VEYLHPLLMVLVVFPAGFAAAAFGIQLQQVRLERSRRKVSPRSARRAHIFTGVAFLLALLAVATLGGFASTALPTGIGTGWHGLGALVVVVLLTLSTALVSLKPLKRLSWSRFVHSVLNGAVMAILIVQFLTGGLIVRTLLRG